MTEPHPQIPICDGQKVFCCEMSPGVESGFIDQLIDRGIGVLDYSTGASLRSEDVPHKDRRSAASQSFRELRELGHCVGYGVLAAEGRDRAAVGRTTPPCMLVFDGPGTNGDDVTLKGFQFDEYGIVTEADYPKVIEVARRRGGVATMTSVSSESPGISGPGSETVVRTFHELERKGELE